MLLLLLAGLSWPGLAQASVKDPFRATIPDTLRFAEKQLRATANALPPTAYPSSTTPNGNWDTTGPGSWTSGFLSGSFWYMHQHTRDPSWRSRADLWQAGIESQKLRSDEHDLGFMLLDSFGHGYRLTGNDTYHQVVLTAAQSFAQRYDGRLGYVRSRGEVSDTEDFKVIIDTMMNLELLFWASRHGGKREWHDMAHQHALKTLESHVREDGSTWQTITLDPETGTLNEQGKEQGCRWNTTWARGQAWAIYGFTVAYRETKDPRLLQAARRTADYFIRHLPSDSVPYWDLAAPNIPNEPRDSSAAAIAASALIELSQLEPQSRSASLDWNAARNILISLSSPVYLARHKQTRSILRHGTAYKPHGKYDTGMIAADYFFIEALLRYSAARPPPGTRFAPAHADAALASPPSNPDVEERPVAGDLTLSFSLRLETLPSSGTRFLSLRSGERMLGNLLMCQNGQLQLRNGETEVSARSNALTPGQVYRVVLRQRRDGSTPFTFLEAFLAREGEPLGCPFASSRVLMPPSTPEGPHLETRPKSLNATIEDLRLDTAPPEPRRH
ncbi:glycoside hydrolase family 88 protein [Archangium sp.]|uniref:glycoside hydrolase family 88 protein n=1 Tax=Archangium sp. TaxID=1872627 RepID=UPI00286CDCFF|nr:glycoside hydrolase family 88 protein [Archangium sp.]